MRKYCLLLCFVFTLAMNNIANATPQWLTLPPTPTLPKAEQSGYAPVNHIRIWYAIFGQGKPVILLHAGLANSNYWGNLVPELAKKYQVIVMDSRGHGRSTRDNQPYSYDLMTSDVIGLMDYLKIKQAAIVGWSDGGIVGINMAFKHPERLTKLFAFGANTHTDGTRDISKNPVIKMYTERAKQEYEKLSPTPKQFQTFFDQINKMWATQPNFTKAELNTITIPTWIADGDHDEAIKRDHTEFMAAQIPNAGLLIQPNTSHFGMLQDPKQFYNDVSHFLEHEPSK